MNEDDRWTYLDGAEPERLRPLFAVMREVPPLSVEDSARMARAFFARLDGTEAAVEAPAPPPPVEAPDTGPPETPLRRALVVPVLPDPSPLSSEVAASAATTFTPGSTPGSAADPDTAPAPVVGAATAPLAFTLEELRKKGMLPFNPDAAVKRAPKTLQGEVTRVGLGETVPAGNDFRRAVALVPFLDAKLPAAVVHVPDLTVEQYASLCAELAVRPEKAGTTVPSYNVGNEAARAALDAHWQSVFVEHPEKGAEFIAHFATFVAYLRTLPK